MSNIPSLTHTLLTRQPIEKLYELSSKRTIIGVEKEIKRRLLSCDPDLSLPVINFLHTYQNDSVVKDIWLQSHYVKEGIRDSINCIPWKIGVIYNYTDQSYRINNVSIVVGKSNAYRMKNNRYYKSNWLNADKTKLILREVISRYNRPLNNKMSVVTHSPELDNAIRHALLNNDTVTITICLFLPPRGNSFHSFPDKAPFSHPEIKEMYPCQIKVGNFTQALITFPENIHAYYPHDYHIKITKTRDYQKLLDLNKLPNIDQI